MDVTQVLYCRCSKNLKHFSIGKKALPTLAFPMCCLPQWKYRVCQSFFGGTNDLTITCNDDTFPVRVALEKYSDVEYVLYNKNGIS